MNISEKVKKDCLSEHYLTKEYEDKLQKAKKRHYKQIEADVINTCRKECKQENTDLSDLMPCIEECVKLKHKKVCDFIQSSSLASSVEDIISLKHELSQSRPNLPRRKIMLSQKIGGYVKTVLEVLSVTWSIIEEFKYGKERERNKDLDDYYASLTDSLLLKVKTLHLSVLMATYDPSMMETLSSIRRLLDERYAEAKTSLDYHNEQLQKYKDLGPEFNILLKAYNNLFDRIQSTKDDIERMRSFQ